MADSYAMDTVATTIADSAVAKITAAKDTLAAPVRRIVFRKDASETKLPAELVVSFVEDEEGDDRDLVFELDWPDEMSVPTHVDYVEEQDTVGPQITERYGVELDWGDRAALLSTLLELELAHAFAEVGPRLARAQVPLAKQHAIYLQDPDEVAEVTTPGANWDNRVRQLVAEELTSDELAAAFPALVFASPKRQAWLAKLCKRTV